MLSLLPTQKELCSSSFPVSQNLPSLKNTDVFHQSASQEEHHSTHVTTGATELKAVHRFAYLGCTITSDTKVDKELDNRPAIDE